MITVSARPFTSRPFTCCECGARNGMTRGCKTNGSRQRDHCRKCGTSLHVQFGDGAHRPCGGVMRVTWTGERPYNGAVSGTIVMAWWRCECGYRLMSVLDEDHPHAGAVLNAVLESEAES